MSECWGRRPPLTYSCAVVFGCGAMRPKRATSLADSVSQRQLGTTLRRAYTRNQREPSSRIQVSRLDHRATAVSPGRSVYAIP